MQELISAEHQSMHFTLIPPHYFHRPIILRYRNLPSLRMPMPSIKLYTYQPAAKTCTEHSYQKDNALWTAGIASAANHLLDILTHYTPPPFVGTVLASLRLSHSDTVSTCTYCTVHTQLASSLTQQPTQLLNLT